VHPFLKQRYVVLLCQRMRSNRTWDSATGVNCAVLPPLTHAHSLTYIGKNLVELLARIFCIACLREKDSYFRSAKKIFTSRNSFASCHLAILLLRKVKKLRCEPQRQLGIIFVHTACTNLRSCEHAAKTFGKGTGNTKLDWEISEPCFVSLVSTLTFTKSSYS
jgi:hypothetical protein